MIISIDGNIASGKTYTLDLLEANGFKVFREPFESNKYLERYYKDPKQWALLTQIEFLTSRKKQYQDAALHSNEGELVFVERSVYTDRYIFANMLHQNEILNDDEWDTYLNHFDTCRTFVPDVSVIIQRDPKTCYELIQKRGRGMESSVKLDYLKSLARFYCCFGNYLGVTNLQHTQPIGSSNIEDLVKLCMDEMEDRNYKVLKRELFFPLFGQPNSR